MALPSVEQLSAAGDDVFASLAALGLAEAVFFAVFAALCGPAPPSLQLFGLLSGDAVRRALKQTQASTEDQRRLALLWRSARLRQGLPDEDLGVPSAPKVADDGRFLAGPLVVAPSSKKEERPIRRRAAELLQALEGDKPLIVKGASYTHGLSSLQAASAGGADLAVEIPLSRWDHSEYFDPEGSMGLGIYARHGAFTELPGPVDPVYFKLGEEKAAELDPTQRACLQEAARAVKSAGLGRQALQNSPTAVYVGSMNFDYSMTAAGVRDRGNMPWAASGVSQALGLRGAAVFLDTGCSSSLVAADLAASAVGRRRAALALALGVNYMLSPLMFFARSSINLLSRTGRSAPFGTSADGYLVGEGCGAVVLARGQFGLARWRASQVMEDGRSAQLTAPSGCEPRGTPFFFSF
ncbi:pks2 [Symbiodinium sp. CCMP2456]|nr:pks2 [Symbiodinium sp. CCMP2456]